MASAKRMPSNETAVADHSAITGPRWLRIPLFLIALAGWITFILARLMFRGAPELPLDEIFFIPVTPLPGTPHWKPEMWDPTGEKFRAFDFLPRPGPEDFLSQLSAAFAFSNAFGWPRCRIKRLLGVFFSRNARRRRMVRHVSQRTVAQLWT